MATTTTNSSLVGESRVFAPYRALGLICGNVPIAVRYVKLAKSTRIYSAVGNFVHTYTAHNLFLTCVSSPLPSDIRYLACDNDYVYAGYDNKVAALHYGRNVKRIYDDHETDVQFILPFGDHLLVIDNRSTLKIWEIETGDLYGEWRFGGPAFSISAVCHPSTYLNKIVFGSKEGSLKLVNVKTGKTIYDFDGWESEVTCLQQSTAVDVLAIGLKDGRIYLHNIKFDETIVSFRQDWGAVTTITFRTDGHSQMLTGSTCGHAAVWDLEKRKLSNQILDAHRNCSTGISTLIALQNEPTVISSGADNALRTWIFDLSDGGARLLKSQEGHGKPSTFLRFHGGERGEYVLSAGGDADVKMFHTISNHKNKNLGEAGTMRKKIAKQKRLNWDNLRLPPIVYMASDSARESGWDNIICCHEDRAIVTTWTSRRSRIGSHKLEHRRFTTVSEFRKAAATCCTVSVCGNYALIGYSSGHVDVFNIQSGIYRGSYIDANGERAHTSSINGLCSDGLNECTFTGDADGKLKFWRFSNKKYLHTIQFEAAITRMVLHRDNDLLAVCLQDGSLSIVDIECKRIVRLFEKAHKEKIADLTFSTDGRWVITTGSDRKAKIWDLPSASLIDVMQFPTSCIGLSMSANGEYLATAHDGKVGVYLWINKTIYSPFLTLKSLPIDYEPDREMALPSSEVVAAISEEAGVEERMEEGGEEREADQLNKDFVTFSGLPTPRWACLLDMDVIKERNKPIEPLKKPEKAPFFLPTVPGVQPIFDIDKAANTEENQSIDTQNRLSSIKSKFQAKSEFAKALENWTESEQVLSLLKRQSPAGVEIELRNLAPINGGSIDWMRQFLLVMQNRLETKCDFEICNAYLGLFVKLHRDVLWTETQLRDELEKTRKAQKECWTRLDDLLNDTLSLVQYLKSSVL